MSNSTFLDSSSTTPNTSISIREEARQDIPEKVLLKPGELIMQMTGTRTYWPGILLASALIAVSIVLLISLAL